MGAEGAEGAVSPLDAALESAMATQSSSGRLATHLDNMQRCQTPTIVAPPPAQAHSMLRTAYGMVQTITPVESIEVMRVVVPLLGTFAQREQMRCRSSQKLKSPTSPLFVHLCSQWRSLR